MEFFDLRTAYLIIGMLYFIMPAAVWLALRGNKETSVNEWCIGGSLFGLGLFLLSRRHYFPHWLTYETAVLVMNLGHLARVMALRRELKRPLSKPTALTLAAAFLLFYEMGRLLDPQGNSYFLVSLFSLALYFFWIAMLAFQLAHQQSYKSATWLGLTYTSLGALTLLHVIRVGTGSTNTNPMQPDWGMIAIVLMGCIAAMIGNTSFMGIFIERATRQQLATTRDQARAVESARLGRQIAHLDRVRSMGMITASVIHELSQPLTSIKMTAELAQMQATAEPTVLKQIGRILNQSRHASEVLQRIRSFMAMKESTHRPVSLQEVNERVISLLHDWLKSENVTLKTDAPDQPVVVSGDSVQLAQILVNLYRNAIEASANSNYCCIQIRIEIRKGRAIFQVHDNGPGFSQQVLQQKDMEFHSAKSGGLGIGLQISRQIALQHGGQLHLRNGTTGGAVVELDLPVRS